MTKNNKTSKKITSILLGFVLLSGTLAMASLPTAAYAEERTGSEQGITTSDFTGAFDLGETLFDDAPTNVYCRVFELPFNNDQVEILAAPTQSFPTAGLDYAVLSTGLGDDIPGTAAGTASTDMVDFGVFPYPLFLGDPNGTDVRDSATLGISCDLPLNAKSLSFDWAFGTEENPVFLPDYADAAFVDSNTYGNVLLLPGGEAVTTNFAAVYSNVPPATPNPDDTQMNAVTTPTYTTTVDVSGEVLTTEGLQFRIFDDEDDILDSALWLDNFVLELSPITEQVCSEDDVICKQAAIMDTDGDNVIEVGELIMYTFHIEVTNDSGEDWTNVVVKDNFGGNLLVNQTPIVNTGDNPPTFDLKGKTEKAQMKWVVGDLANGESATLVLAVETDTTPSGDQSYTECGEHDINSGANVKYRDERNKQQSYVTPSLTVNVLDVTDFTCDYDGDGHSDAKENNDGTDPTDPNDHVSDCYVDLIVLNDTCIDGDGIATPLRGTFSAVFGDTLNTWPTGFWNEGIDMFDTDGSGSWTLGDDIHLERTASCATGFSNGFHETGQDCVLLDLDGSLAVAIPPVPVDCDLETGTFCSLALATELLTTGIKFIDSNTNTYYTNGEDIIKDNNGNGIFD